MRYYADIQFSSASEERDCRATLVDWSSPGVALNLCLAGSFWFRDAEGHDEVVTGPVVFWTWPGRRFSYGVRDGVRWHHFWALAHGPRTARMLREGLVPRLAWPILPLREVQAFETRMRRLVSLIRSSRPSAHAEAVVLWEELWVRVDAERRAQVPRSPADAVERLATRIAEDPCAAWDFPREAREAGISYPHLRRVFRQVTGSPPHELVLRCRMRRAAELLAAGGLRVREVAALTGYDDLAYFSRLFRRKIGVAPGAMRRRTT